jgi:hypothetical protein
MGLTMSHVMGKIAMSILFATLALTVALIAGALVAPRTGDYSGLRLDPCALETAGWSMTDPNCVDMRIGTTPRTTPHYTVVGNTACAAAAGAGKCGKAAALSGDRGRTNPVSMPDDATSSFGVQFES